MKQLSLLQPRRTNDTTTTSSAVKSPTTLLWLLLHALCCLISLILGFRFSRLIFFLLFSHSSTTTILLSSPSILTPPIHSNLTDVLPSRVIVGRHGILIRPWPHPNPVEVMRAHKIIQSVQNQQRVEFGVKEPRTVIVVTPTYVRTFQVVHLSGVMHSVMNLPFNVVWIVVEAGGVSNETKAIVVTAEKVKTVSVVHLGFQKKMPVTWKERGRVEDLMRVYALRSDRLIL